MARRRKSRGLGSPSAKHAKMAETLVAGAERHAECVKHGGTAGLGRARRRRR